MLKMLCIRLHPGILFGLTPDCPLRLGLAQEGPKGAYACVILTKEGVG
jgi:hypothetical protein